jgi:hypothetical protein
MPIVSHVDTSKDLTTIVGTGVLEEVEICDAIESLCRKSHTGKFLWDLREANVGRLKSDSVRHIADMLKDMGCSRRGIKAAIVTPVNVVYGLARMLLSYLDSKDTHHVTPMNLFTTIESARGWLDAG